jgi:hypothetical protein
MSRGGTLALLTTLLASCSNMPDASRAQAAYDAHRATIDRVTQVLRRESSMLLHAPPVCEDAAAVAASGDEARNREFEACTERRRAELSSQAAEWGRFRGVLLTLVETHHDILGLGVALSTPGRPPLAADVGMSGPSQTGEPAASGFRRGDRAVGYHLYQTAFAFDVPGAPSIAVGDGEHRPGLEVVFTVSSGTSSMRVALIVLIEDETTPAWRAAQRTLLARSGVTLPAAPRGGASP